MRAPAKHQQQGQTQQKAETAILFHNDRRVKQKSKLETRIEKAVAQQVSYTKSLK